MKNHYCWRCQAIVPMLEEDEWEKIAPLLELQSKEIKKYRELHHVDLSVAIKEVHKPATDLYFGMTGYREDNYAAILHHRLSYFGPECPVCGSLLRTSKAKLCANCGWRK